MRILHVFQFSPWFKSRIYPIFLGLKDLGHEMTVIGTSPKRLIGTRIIKDDGFTYRKGQGGMGSRDLQEFQWDGRL